MAKSNEFVGVDDKFIPESEKENMKKADIEAESRQKKVTKFTMGYLIGLVAFVVIILVVVIVVMVNMLGQHNKTVEEIYEQHNNAAEEIKKQHNKEYGNSSLIGQMPVSFAFKVFNLFSNPFLRVITSIFVTGVHETY